MVAIPGPLQKAVGLLSPEHTSLKNKILHQYQFLSHRALRVTVFGPFNHGKSTLLNALLGNKTLPIDLVPTTGAAITLTYGSKLTSRITLTDGHIEEAPGTELLQRYAILDAHRQMRQDVAAIQVQCPHPLLQSGIELIDLPGTDDQENHNELIHTRLLETDVVLQLLDGRKLMTLTERDHLQNWLLERGLTAVLFVVNFLNLLEPEDKQQVLERLQALDVGTPLPNGMSRVYAVDALPALRAQMKGEQAALLQTGLPALEFALQRLVQDYLPQATIHRRPRLIPLIEQLQQILHQQLCRLKETPPSRQALIQQRAQQLIQKGFHQSVADLEDWLQLTNLLRHYQSRLATELQANRAGDWLETTLKPAWERKQQDLVDWVVKACEVFERPCPTELRISWPSLPAVSSQVWYELAYIYLAQFSKTALRCLRDYQQEMQPTLQVKGVFQERQAAHETLLRNTLIELDSLHAELASDDVIALAVGQQDQP